MEKEQDKNGEQSVIKKNINLLFYIIGIFLCYMYFAVAQEKIYKNPIVGDDVNISIFFVIMSSYS